MMYLRGASGGGAGAAGSETRGAGVSCVGLVWSWGLGSRAGFGFTSGLAWWPGLRSFWS